jgi:RNA polymerase sigma-70 factor (ECF subfamily)
VTRSRAADDLDLASLIERCRRRWPEVPVPTGLEDYLRQRVPPGQAVGEWLASAKLDDLYLACACSEGSEAALLAFEREHIAKIPVHLARMRPTADFVDDVMQVIRERVFVGNNGRPPRIGEYSGKGALGAWVRVMAVRAAIDLQRGKTELPNDAALAEATTSSGAADAEYVKRRYGALLTAALARAITTLTQEQRTLLRLHFAEKNTLDQLAAKLGNHPATVWRKIAAARSAIVEATRKILREDELVATDDFNSILRTVHSQLDISLSRL